MGNRRSSRSLPWICRTLAKTNGITGRLTILAFLFATPLRAGEERPPPLLAPFSAEKAKQRQQAWAKHLHTNVETTNGIGVVLVLIPKGEFLMGSPDSDPDAEKAEKPQHRVRISKSFWLGKYEVRRGEFRKFVTAMKYKTDAETDGKGGTGYTHNVQDAYDQKPEFTWLNPGFEQPDDHPVVNVSWNDAVKFCEWLSKKEGQAYRLPTEAEWEWACRAGTTERWNCGDQEGDLESNVNIADASLLLMDARPDRAMKWNDRHCFTSRAGSFKSNQFGLCDMHGNVWEWCSDWYGGDFYATSPIDDPKGATESRYHACRGGGWRNDPSAVRSAYRFYGTPEDRDYSIGFRVVRDQ